MIGKGIFHVHLVVKDLEKSKRFYTGLFGFEDTGYKDGALVFLKTPGREDLLTLNPNGTGGDLKYPCNAKNAPETDLAGVQGGMSHFGYMLPSHDAFEQTITSAEEFGGRLLVRCEHLGEGLHAYLSDPDGYVVELHCGR